TFVLLKGSSWTLDLVPVFSQRIDKNINIGEQYSNCRCFPENSVNYDDIDHNDIHVMDNEGIQLRILKTTGQMRHLKKKDKSSRKKCFKKKSKLAY
ncbi:hypothetical protein STEG23_008605, partial [Scotinomys teguina]